MLISVIAPCRGEGERVHRFVANVLAQRLPPGWRLELLLAAGGEIGGHRSWRRDPRVRVLANPRLTTPAALNIGLRNARGRVIARMDVHTDYAPDYLAACLQALEETHADNVGGPWVARGEGVWGRAIALAFQSKWATGGGRAHDPRYEGWVDTVYLGCWRREAFERYGLFDEQLIRGQDSEHNLRIRRCGGRIWQTPRIRSWYTPRQRLDRLFRQYAQWGYWKMAILRKHRRPASLRQLAPAVGLALLGALLSASAFEPALTVGAAALVAFYLSLTLTFSALCCAQARAWPLLPLLPPVFWTYHAGFAWGTLRGAVDFLLLRRGSRASFQRLTRAPQGARQARGQAAGR